MESLHSATSRAPTAGQSKEWMERANTSLKLLGSFLLINGIYFAIFSIGIYTALVYYSFVLMVLTAVGYCYYFTAEDVECLLYSWQATGSSMIDSFNLLGVRSAPEPRSTPKRRQL